MKEAAELAKDAQTLTDQEWDQKYDPGARRSGIDPPRAVARALRLGLKSSPL